MTRLVSPTQCVVVPGFMHPSPGVAHNFPKAMDVWNLCISYAQNTPGSYHRMNAKSLII